MSDNSDALGPLNEVLSEVIDVLRDARYARWVFTVPGALTAELAALQEDARGWVQSLVMQDEAHGVSPLGLVPTASGRQGVDIGPETATPDDLCAALDRVLDRLGHHVAAASETEQDEGVVAALGEVARGVRTHREVLAGLLLHP